MKIAATYWNGDIFQHFGHTEYFKIYQTESGAVKNAEVISAEGYGHGALAGFLSAHHVNVLVCGGIGGGALEALKNAGTQVYAGASGNADDCIAAFLAGTLQLSDAANCAHHEHGEGRSCGGHGHSCGGGRAGGGCGEK